MSGEFEKIKLEQLTDNFAKIVGGSPETPAGQRWFADRRRRGPGRSQRRHRARRHGQAGGAQEVLRRPHRARPSGEMDPIVGRDEEIRQIVDILMRRKQNNPILTGEAGVGKTAVVEGFAQRIAAGDVPPPLKDVSLRSLDIGLLQAGASMKGEFENRLRRSSRRFSPRPSPSSCSSTKPTRSSARAAPPAPGDAANLLKPALARGKLRTIAATTWAEYKKHIEKDPALTRRFQVVQVGEPSEAKALLMMRGIASTLEKHHRIQILDDALESAVKLSHRYIPARQLPDKAVSLLDTACARVAISQHAVPAEVDDSRRRIQALDTEIEIIKREMPSASPAAAARNRGGGEAGRREAAPGRAGRALEQGEGAGRPDPRPAQPTARAASGKVEGTDSKLEAKAARPRRVAPRPRPGARPRVKARRRASRRPRSAAGQAEPKPNGAGKLQGDHPLILPTVDAQAVASVVVGDWTGIPSAAW
jgi:type VI secretion system protein VasG